MIVQLTFTLQGPPAIAGSHTATNAFLYRIANPKTTAIRLDLFDAGGLIATFQSAAANPYANQLYRLENAALDRNAFLLRAQTAIHNHTLTARIGCNIECREFFYHVVSQMAYNVADFHNFADPAQPNPILNSVTPVATHLNPTDTQWIITFHPRAGTLANTPVIVTALAAGAAAHTALLSIHLNLNATPFTAAQQLEACQLFIASDWSRLLDCLHALPPQPPDPAWDLNIRNYMLRYLPLTRGQALMDRARALGVAASGVAIGNVALDGTQKQQHAVTAFRNEIDRFLITANPWGDATNVGAYPQAIHIILAVSYGAFAAMPIRFARVMRDAATINQQQKRQMVAQMGMGNCGEHGDITFNVIRAAMQNDPPTQNLLRYVTRSGYSNIDHCFVVGGEMPVAIVDVVVRVDDHGAHKARNDRRNCWDAYPALTAGAGAVGRQGWICDPYLAQGQIAATLVELCTHERVRQWLNWSAFHHPAFALPLPINVDADAANHTHIHVAGFCDQPLTLAGCWPNHGFANVGTPATLTGTHFEAGVKVRIHFGDPDPLQNLLVVNSTSITGTIPLALIALWRLPTDIIVNNPDEAEVNLLDGFTYDVVPSYTDVAPRSGPSGGWAPVTITGDNFDDPVQVFFGPNAALHTLVTNPQTIQATTPPGVGLVAIRIVNPDGGTITSAPVFQYLPPPNVFGLSLAEGPVNVQTAGIQVNGANFVHGATVFFGGLLCPAIVFNGANQLTVTAPAQVGSVNVTVTNPDGQQATLVNGFQYRVLKRGR